MALWLCTPSIVLGLYVEAEIGEYFEEPMAWHNRSGPAGRRSGFRMRDMHYHYFKFELPWWNQACETPVVRLPKTVESIERHFDGDEKAQRTG